jgi:hypothetical protein
MLEEVVAVVVGGVVDAVADASEAGMVVTMCCWLKLSIDFAVVVD